MLKRLAAVLLYSAIISFSSAQVKKENPSKDKGEIIFSVARSVVTTDEFIYLYKKNHQGKADEFSRAKIEEYLRLFIDFKLKVEEARHRGMDTTAAFIKEYNSYRAELRKPYLPDNSLTDSLARLTYERMKEEIRAAHILISLKTDPTPADTLAVFKRIMEIRSKVLAGLDFSQAAAQFSEDPSAKTNQGDLGYFSALQMVFPFENAAYASRVGEISLPVRTRFGYHLIHVLDRRPSRGEIETSHIMIRLRNDQDPEKAKNTIFTVYDQLQAGVPWNELCRQYSEDPASKDQGGRLRPFGIGSMSTVPEFEKAAFTLSKPGDISDPIKTQYGWHIIRLERKIPLASYDAMSTSLKNRVARDERISLSKQAIQEKLRAKYGFHENESLKLKAISLGDSSLLRGMWKKPASAPDDNAVLFSLTGKNILLKDFYVYVQKNQRKQNTDAPKYMEQLYNNLVESSIMEVLEENIISEHETYRYLLKEYYEGILLFEIMEKEVWTRASNDSTGQRKYYAGHLSKYQAADRTRAVIYSAASDAGMDKLKELLSTADERAIQDFIIANKIKMEAGYFKKDEKDIFTKVPWLKGVYSVENNGMYYLAWLKDILPPGAMSFEEARPAVISDFQAAIEKNWLDQLKKKYRVKVNEKGKNHVLQSLESK